MERQSSFGSQGSGKSSATKLVKDAQKHGESVESQNANNGFTTALFGVLFTLAKEKYSDSWKVAVLTVVVDFLLIMAIMFNLEYPWAVDPHNGVFKFFYMLEIHKPLSTAGYKFYVIVFYLLSAMLYVSVAICVWVAWCFKNDSFPYLWPIKFVRIVASVFFGMLYIAALNIFLVIIECAPEHGHWMQHIWHKECLAMPHLIHSVFSVLSCVTFAVAALLLVIADHELQPMSRSLLAAPHSMTELKAQLAKTVITVVDVLLWDFPKVQGVTFALCTVATFYFHLKQLPYYTSWMNSFRLCFFAVHAWTGSHLAVLVFMVKAKMVKKGSLGFARWDIENEATARAITNSMLYGLPVVFFGAGLLGAIRLYYFFRVALKFQILQQQPNLYSKRIYRFSDEKDVEICSRIGRLWDEEGVPDPAALDLAETIIRAGIQQFPKSPYLHIVYANLLIECRQQLQSGWSQMEEARRMPLNLSYRFSIFTREQEHKQKAAVSSSGESAADLVSYVEFQRNYRMIQSYHKAALLAMREFWRLLLYDAVNMNSLTSAFRKIEQMERLADKTYKMVLERYPKAVKLLRSYALFLETVKNDPWTAAQFYTEAEKQEEALENAEHDLAGEEGLTMRNSAIVTINAMGIIQMANKHAIKMLGYNKGELEGKNVSCLMPQPFSARHNGYMRNYVTTGKAKILDALREVVALHRDRYVFPIKILVTKSQGNGADAIFMGLLKEVESDPNQIKAWLMPNGVTLCADQSFTDYAGWAPNDLIGKPFNTIAVDPVAMDRFLDRAVKATEEEMADGSLQEEVLLVHKYAEDVPVTVRIEMGGTSDQRLLVLIMTRVGEVVPTMVLDHHGRVLFANQALCSLLGTKPKDMRGRDMGTLLPQPFGYLHHRWIKDAESALITSRPPPSSCRAGMVHSMVSSNGVHVPVRMVITSRELPGGVHVNIVRATRVTLDEALDEQRLNVTTDQHGHIISVSSAAHHGHGSSSMPGVPPPPVAAAAAAEPGKGEAPRPQVFGYPPENLVGRKLYEAVDIFQEWHAAGHSVMHAVKALAQHSSARPGSAWRVGVLLHYLSPEIERAAARLAGGGHRHSGVGSADGQEGEEADGLGPAADGRRQSIASMATDRQQANNRRSMRRSATLLRQSLPKWRAAIMQVMGPEHTATGTHYTVKLWRPEMLSGVLELNEKMVVAKADSAAGLIFGVPSYTMSQQPLSRFLKLGPPGSTSMRKLPGMPAPPGAGNGGGEATRGSTAASSVREAQPPQAQLITKESLLGQHHVKGGMKGGKLAHKTGPRRIFEARHADGMPLQISFQVALKNGTSSSRLMAAIKPLNLIPGNVAVLYAAMRGEDLDHYTIEDVASRSFHHSRTHASSHSQQQPQQPLPAQARRVSVESAAVAATPRRQGTSKLGGDAAAAGAGAELPLGKMPSGLSAKATRVAPGMSSARTLEATTVGGGSGTTRRSDGTEEGGGKKGGDKGGGGGGDPAEGFDALHTIKEESSAEFSGLATARNIELKLKAAGAGAEGAGEGADGKQGGDGKAEGGDGVASSADQPPTPERGGSASGTAAAAKAKADKDSDGKDCSSDDANRAPVSDDSAMLATPPPAAGSSAPGAAEGTTRGEEPAAGKPAAEEGEEPQSQLQGGAHHHHRRNLGSRHLSRKFLTREWDHVHHVDPEEVPIPHDVDYDIEHHWGDEKDMTVSSSSHDDDGSDSEDPEDDVDGSESDRHVGRNTEGAADKMTREEALQRKKTMAALEPGERVQYVKGVRRVKEWLASGYYFDRRDAEPETTGTDVHRNLVSSGGGGGGGGDPWRGGPGRQLSRVDEENDGPGGGGGGGGAGHHKHGGAGAAAGAAQDDGLDPDDQLVTLDELAAEVEQQDEKSDEDDGGDGDGGGGGGGGGRGSGEGAGSGGGGKRRHVKHAWEEEGGGGGVGGHSHAATAGGGSAGGGRHRGEGGGGGGSGKEDASGHSGVDSSGMSRGRRLKRLLKLLSGQKVSRGVSRLRLHVLVVIGAMMLVHTVCFMLVIIYINKQKQFITEISAAGEAIDRTFYTAMYTRAIEAATRSAGFASADISSLEARLTTDVDRLEFLHQGLYLGFGKLRRSPSTKLNNLWDLKQWNVTEYKDTKVPSFTYVITTLWSLGNDFVSAVREVAYYAAAKKLLLDTGASSSSASAALNGTASSPPPPQAVGAVASNVTLPLNRFWLFVRDNAGESLYTGYLRVLDTLLLLAQDNIGMLKLIIIALLLVEGCLVCFAAVGYVFWLMWKATRARAALFTVFLVIPQGQLRALASRHITTAHSDDDSDEEGAGGKGKGDGGGDRGGSGGGAVDDQVSDGASILSGGAAAATPSAAGGGGARRSFTFAENPRVSNSGSVSGAGGGARKGITFKEGPKRKAGAAKPASETVLSRIRHAMSGEVTVPATEKPGQTRRFFTKKRLTHTTSDIKHLAWPFFGWGALIVIIYCVSYFHFSSVEESLVNLKMFERSTGQASRTMYYVNELALEQNAVRQASLQPIVGSEASWLDSVYSTTLYGGRTLADSERQGAHDKNSGSLFAREHHAQMLFASNACLRDSSSTCLSNSDEFYEVTRHAIDPMMRRLMQEATLISLDDLRDVNHTSSRWQYVWTVAQADLHDGLESLVDSYQSDALAAFKAQGTLHTVVFAIAWVLWALYLWLLLKPYLQISSTETKRVAEMLSQLPAELDVEGMVAESWLVVADTQLQLAADKEKEKERKAAEKAAAASAAAAGGSPGGKGGWARSVPSERKMLSVSNLALSVFAAMRLRTDAAEKKNRLSENGGSVQSRGAKGGDGGAEDEYGGDPPKARGNSIGSDGGQSLFSDKLKAALKGVGAKGLDVGDGVDLSGDSKAKWRSGGLADAPQVAVTGSSLFGPSGATVAAPSARPRSARGGKVSPADSARVGTSSSPSSSRPGSARVGGGSNCVVPAQAVSASGQWVAPEGGGGAAGGSAVAVADAVERPRSSLLGISIPQGPGPAPSSEIRGGSPGAGAGSGPLSPFHFNKVMPIHGNNTREWSEDTPWRPPSAARRASVTRVSATAAAESPRNGGSGGRMASPVVAALAAAAAGSAAAENQALLPGEVDDPRVAAERAASASTGSASASVSLVGSRVGSATRRSPAAVTPPPQSTSQLPPQPELLLVDASEEVDGDTAADRDALAAGSSRPASPLVLMAAAGSRVGTPTAPSPLRPASAAASPVVVAATEAAAGSRVGTPTASPSLALPVPAAAAAATAGSRVGTPVAMSPASPPVPASAQAVGSRVGTPTAALPAATAATAAGASRVGTPAGGESAAAVAASSVPSLVRRSGAEATATTAGSRPASRLSGAAASIELPPPPPFSRTGSASGMSAGGGAAAVTSLSPLANLTSLNAAAAATAPAVPLPAADLDTPGSGGPAQPTSGRGGSRPSSSSVAPPTSMEVAARVDDATAPTGDAAVAATAVAAAAGSRPGSAAASSTRASIPEIPVTAAGAAAAAAAAAAGGSSSPEPGQLDSALSKPKSPILAFPSHPVQGPPS